MQDYPPGDKVEIHTPLAQSNILTVQAIPYQVVTGCTVIGPVNYEPSMTMVRLPDGQATRAMTEYLQKA